ncbi:MAG TPA: bifunctional precorrin-2 dehydrogenase/sirohydrochlorin ferrochelatase [Vicinamibacterales bacterium]|nr:bifunctional precorrin-2 dehydrogenase/sirohydrochlorin ferrochelatase [Vicinamibacterales bacterium]
MQLPDYVEPFVDTEPERWRVTVAVLVTIALAVLAQWEPRVLGYAAALTIGALAAWLWRSRSNGGTLTTPPRLPVFLRFDNRRVVVVGAGAMAAAKIPALLAAGARIEVVAPSISPAIRAYGVEIVEREFAPSDLDGAWFVTAAATPDVNRAVREAAESRGVFVNAVDDPANATAYLGGTITRGGVTVAFSTAGRAPALAGLLREGFDALLPADIDRWAERAHELSVQQRREAVPITARRPQLLAALNQLYESRERQEVRR